MFFPRERPDLGMRARNDRKNIRKESDLEREEEIEGYDSGEKGKEDGRDQNKLTLWR